MQEIQYHGEPVKRSAPAAPQQTFRQLSFHGDGSTLFGIFITNLFLTVLTLGIYLFWGRVKARRYVFGQVEFEGDRFAYHATGKELLVGWLKVALVFAVLYGVKTAAGFLGIPGLALAVEMVTSLAFIFLLPVAIVGSRRFRLSRTSWRGIRFSFRGRARDFLKLYLRGMLLTVITFGVYYPFFMNDVQRFLTTHSYFGTSRFDYDGQGRDLLKIYLLTRFLPLVAATLICVGAIAFAVTPYAAHDVRSVALAVFGGVLLVFLVFLGSWPWFAAARDRYAWSHTTFAAARFRSTVTAGRLFRLYGGDLVRLVFTLGLALPWVVVRHVRFRCANLILEGPLDLAAVQQEAQAASAVGAGLGDFVGILDFDLGL